ncbi:uncharacterized protein [Aegilops tauschii subsp. strangulata]|uniref:uncharacterized protein n=1 Tax=Aegilops tauschii subsp. strangulata TaxID=200361 RepID=UPI00098AD5CE|nr:uncharacterized protein LOC109779752 [Aegilops tauschii subsp. strangulata]
MGIRRLICRGDSDLVIQQVMKTFDTKDPKMAAYYAAVWALEGKFDGLELHHVKRSDNITAGNLARVGSSREPVPDETFLEILHKPSIKMQGLDTTTTDPDTSEIAALKVTPPSSDTSEEAVMVIHTQDSIQPLHAYMTKSELPQEKKEARHIVSRSKAYTIINGELYKRSQVGVFQRCVPKEEGKKLLEEIHAGACDHHAAPRTIAAKAFRHNFFWPHAMRDAEEIV